MSHSSMIGHGYASLSPAPNTCAAHPVALVGHRREGSRGGAATGAPYRTCTGHGRPVSSSYPSNIVSPVRAGTVLGTSTDSVRSRDDESPASSHPRTDLEVGLPTGTAESERCRAMLGAARAEVTRWRRQTHIKPRAYDSRQALSLPRGTELCCLTRGGRVASAWKLDNQDSFLAQHVPPAAGANFAPRGALVLGVFDGHGSRGGDASRMVRDAMAATITQAATRSEGLEPKDGHAGFNTVGGPGGDLETSNTEKPHATSVLVRAFQDAEIALTVSGRDYSRSGTTAVLCAVEPGRITTAWTGDSRAVLGLSPFLKDGRVPPVHDHPMCYSVHALTEDHSPSLERERARIFRSGGAVRQTHRDAQRRPIGPLRVCFPGTTSPGLAISRALGDTMAATIGVSSEPELSSVVVPDDRGSSTSTGALTLEDSGEPHHVLIVATDGLWQWIGNEAAVDIAASCSTPQEAADRLCNVARLRWVMHQGGYHVDDITVIVLFLPCSF